MAITADRRLPVRSAHHNPAEPSLAFLHLPVEIRLQIYSYLLPIPASYTFEIRTLLPQQVNFYHYKRRSKYNVSKPTGLYSSSASTTYYLSNAPGSGAPSSDSESSKLEPLYPQILSVCRTTYLEARPLLYAKRTFDFGKDTTAIVPFFEDLLPSTRAMVRSVGLTRMASWRCKDFDEAVWRHTCEYLADNCRVERIKLGVVTAKIPNAGQGAVVTMQTQKYKAEDFRTLLNVGYEGMEWVRDFLLLSRRWAPQDHPGDGRWYLPGWGQQEETEEGEKQQGLKELIVEEEVEHCQRIDNRSSGAMAFYVTFSRSLKGFERFLKSEMLDEVDDWGRKVD